MKKSWWIRLQLTPWWSKFIEWRIGRQSKRFSKELTAKGYKPRQPWNTGIWK
tara:strand:- start:484 stop:639 length:156 start_codon:yes stop_codon:yes gene_type:complete